VVGAGELIALLQDEPAAPDRHRHLPRFFRDRQLKNVAVKARCCGEQGDRERHLLNLHALNLPPDHFSVYTLPERFGSTTSPDSPTSGGTATRR